MAFKNYLITHRPFIFICYLSSIPRLLANQIGDLQGRIAKNEGKFMLLVAGLCLALTLISGSCMP